MNIKPEYKMIKDTIQNLIDKSIEHILQQANVSLEPDSHDKTNRYYSAITSVVIEPDKMGTLAQEFPKTAAPHLFADMIKYFSQVVGGRSISFKKGCKFKVLGIEYYPKQKIFHMPICSRFTLPNQTADYHFDIHTNFTYTLPESGEQVNCKPLHIGGKE